MENALFDRPLESLCAALAESFGIAAPSAAAAPDERLTAYVREKTGGKGVDRLFLYNPDAVADWIYRKYADFCAEAVQAAPLELGYRTVMPSVTPVCFGTFYTGASPEVHGIRRYEKPVIRIDSLFDAALRAGKRAAIVAEEDCSMARIFLERGMDYYIYDTIAEVNAAAAELIDEDRYDLLAVYNGNYDATMHRCGPESARSLAELRANVMAFAAFAAQIRRRWTGHDTLIGFAMDHGCHETENGGGAHGLDIPEDLNITHLYEVLPAAEKR